MTTGWDSLKNGAEGCCETEICDHESRKSTRDLEKDVLRLYVYIILVFSILRGLTSMYDVKIMKIGEACNELIRHELHLIFSQAAVLFDI